MSNFITTNIRLPEEDYLRLKAEAAKSRKSLAAVIRGKIGERQVSKDERLKMLLNLNTDWFTEKDYKSYQKSREQLKKRSKQYNW